MEILNWPRVPLYRTFWAGKHFKLKVEMRLDKIQNLRDI